MHINVGKAKAIKVLKRSIDSQVSLSEYVSIFSEEFQLWKRSTEASLKQILGIDSPYILEFQRIQFRAPLLKDVGGYQVLGATPEEQHGELLAGLAESRVLLTTILEEVEEFAELEQIQDSISQTIPVESASSTTDSAHAVFIGHGKSLLWMQLKDFLEDDLKVTWEEFNRESVAGRTTQDRLQEMLSNARFAFLVMTAEDEHPDGTKHPRENVIHEAGLFQGKVGFERSIILMEEGCSEFSNIIGLTQIRFPRGNIKAAFEDVRKVLKREGVI